MKSELHKLHKKPPYNNWPLCKTDPTPCVIRATTFRQSTWGITWATWPQLDLAQRPPSSARLQSYLSIICNDWHNFAPRCMVHFCINLCYCQIFLDTHRHFYSLPGATLKLCVHKRRHTHTCLIVCFWWEQYVGVSLENTNFTFFFESYFVLFFVQLQIKLYQSYKITPPYKMCNKKKPLFIIVTHLSQLSALVGCKSAFLTLLTAVAEEKNKVATTSNEEMLGHISWAFCPFAARCTS